MMSLCIDRFEGEYAICEDENRRTFRIPRTLLSPQSREGDVLLQTKEGYQVDREQTKCRREQAAKLQRRLFGH